MSETDTPTGRPGRVVKDEAILDLSHLTEVEDDGPAGQRDGGACHPDTVPGTDPTLPGGIRGT